MCRRVSRAGSARILALRSKSRLLKEPINAAPPLSDRSHEWRHEVPAIDDARDLPVQELLVGGVLDIDVDVAGLQGALGKRTKAPELVDHVQIAYRYYRYQQLRTIAVSNSVPTVR